MNDERRESIFNGIGQLDAHVESSFLEGSKLERRGRLIERGQRNVKLRRFTTRTEMNSDYPANHPVQPLAWAFRQR